MRSEGKGTAQKGNIYNNQDKETFRLRFNDQQLKDVVQKALKLDKPLRDRILINAVTKATLVFETRIKNVSLSAPSGPSDDLHAVTGWLRGSVAAQPATVVGNKVIGRIIVGAKYGLFHEVGTRPYKIVPKKANMLAWPIGSAIFGTGKRAGQINKAGKVPMAFAKSVQHPGLRVRRPFGRALEHAPTSDIAQRILINDIFADVEKELGL